jgi:glycerophosphoryl diester phosphodiesterase
VSNLVIIPFGLDYKNVASAVSRLGVDAVIADFVAKGYSETVARVYIRRALSKGWGS